MSTLYSSKSKKSTTNSTVKDWKEKNKTSINDYNKRVAKNGTFSHNTISF